MKLTPNELRSVLIVERDERNQENGFERGIAAGIRIVLRTASEIPMDIGPDYPRTADGLLVTRSPI